MPSALAVLSGCLIQTAVRLSVSTVVCVSKKRVNDVAHLANKFPNLDRGQLTGSLNADYHRGELETVLCRRGIDLVVNSRVSSVTQGEVTVVNRSEDSHPSCTLCLPSVLPLLLQALPVELLQMHNHHVAHHNLVSCALHICGSHVCKRRKSNTRAT